METILIWLQLRMYAPLHLGDYRKTLKSLCQRVISELHKNLMCICSCGSFGGKTGNHIGRFICILCMGEGMLPKPFLI
jgi:hypothetical protein